MPSSFFVTFLVIPLKKELTSKLRSLIGNPGFRPSSKSELAKELGVSPKHRSVFRQVLIDLENKGELVRGHKGRYRRHSRKSGSDTVIGRMQFSRDQKRNSGFFIPDNPDANKAFRNMDRPRVFVPGRFSSTALDGDTVEVKLVRDAPQRRGKAGKRRHPGRFEDDELKARVVRIVERGRESIVGKFHGKGGRATVAPDDGRLPASFRLTKVLPNAKPGDVVVAKFTGWENPHVAPTVVMTEVLGRENDPGVDMLAIIHRYGLPLKFPEAVLAEADAIEEKIPRSEIDRREDWREREVFTIDPEDAKDFDDAICVTGLKNGGWELAVHIADVSHYVRPGSALDVEAKKRGNSVYLADRVIPMLPEKLSNGVCSLKPDVERLTHCALMEFDSTGKFSSARFVSAVIRSHKRYSYEQAYAIMMLDEATIGKIQNDKDRSLANHLKRAWKLASLMRDRRFANGALDLDFPEVKVVLDDQGRAIDIKRSEYDESHQLIEEFMLAANEAVAYETKNAPAPSIYRIHEDPDPGKLEEFADLARSFGHKVGDVTHRPELQKLLRNIKGKLEEHSVKIALLKSLRRAEYSKDPVGHYGLVKGNYTHFTSPIRRYADLIVHRVLRRILSRRREATAPGNAERTPAIAEMTSIADHISKTERVAADAERDTQQLKLIEYLEHVTANEPDKTFDAVVYEVRPIGAFMELKNLMVKGMIRKDDLSPRDEYYFDRVRNEYRSRNNAPTIAAGSELKVRLYKVDRDRGFIDFAPA